MFGVKVYTNNYPQLKKWGFFLLYKLFYDWATYGGVPEWLKGTGCKPVGLAYVGSNPTPSTMYFYT